MKVRLEIDDSLNEDEIVIHTKEYTEELKQLLSNFKSKPSIQFFKQDTEYYLDLDAILFFESDNGRVYAHTANDMFFTIQKLYELENIEYIKLDRDKSTFKSHRDFSSEIEITFKHF